MSARRGKGEGSIYRRQDGRWVGAIDLGWENGKRLRKHFYGKTRREVAQKLTEAVRRHQEGLRPARDDLTVAEFLDNWLMAARGTVKQRTWKGYESYLRNHAVPALGRLRLSRLEPHHLQKLYADLVESGRSSTTAHHLHAVLHRALRQAERWGHVPRNVAALVDPPRMARREMQTLSAPQVRDLLDAASGDRLKTLYVVAVTTGMRQGELLALRWRDVDLEQGVLRIRGNLQGGEIVEPKSAKSRRQIELAATTVRSLRLHRQQQNRERLALGAEWVDMDLVFANHVGRPLSPSNLVRRSFKPLLRRAGLPEIRFHDLRHTAATLLLSQGVHPKIVSEMLGHSQISVTLDLYSHVTPTLQRDAARAFDALLGAEQMAP